MFIAFSTATPDLVDGRQRWSTLENEEIDPLLAATGRRDGANAGSDQTNVYSEDELAKVTERLSDLGYLE